MAVGSGILYPNGVKLYAPSLAVGRFRGCKVVQNIPVFTDSERSRKREHEDFYYRVYNNIPI